MPAKAIEHDAVLRQAKFGAALIGQPSAANAAHADFRAAVLAAALIRALDRHAGKRFEDLTVGLDLAMRHELRGALRRMQCRGVVFYTPSTKTWTRAPLTTNEMREETEARASFLAALLAALDECFGAGFEAIP
jgi:hypothetical protein